MYLCVFILYIITYTTICKNMKSVIYNNIFFFLMTTQHDNMLKNIPTIVVIGKR